MRAYERLMRYAQVATASDDSCDTCPSSPGQWELARLLKEEMERMGVSNIVLDDNCYLRGEIPAQYADDNAPTIGFIAHMDVSPDAPSQAVHPRLLTYTGGNVTLHEDDGLSLSADELKEYIGHELVVTDGTTLLGADDKAGIAIILSAAERMLTDKNRPHARIMLGFTPDEEIGRGADKFDVKAFGADFAFTVDGDQVDGLDYETFNAVSAVVQVRGRGIHPGEAKGRMLNAQLVAMEFQAQLPAGERPEYTDGYDGFYHLTHMQGGVEQATLNYILRDHDADKLAQRCNRVNQTAEALNQKYGEGTVRVDMTESYRNMAEKILEHPKLLDVAREAICAAGNTPLSRPVRGGTDGSRLSFMGLPCPNLGTGSHNHHSRREFASVQAMDQSVEILLHIAEKMSAQKLSEM